MDVYVILLLLISEMCCFNIDTKNVITLRGVEGTNFGYSAVMFRNNDGQKWVFVGATNANFTNDPNIVNPGNIYKCSLDFRRSTPDDCAPLNIRTNDNPPYRWVELPGYEEDHELLGASMKLICDSVVTCAPLWKNMIPVKSSGFAHAIGRCFNVDRNSFNYTSNQFKQTYFQKYIPENRNELTFEVAQIGFSVSNKQYVDKKLPVLIGAPGFFANKGGFLEYSATDTSNQFFNSFTYQELTNDQKKSIAAGTLLGYSITTGKLPDANADCPSVIVLGAPHYNSADGIVGAVLVLCVEASGKKLKVKKQFFGRKPGSGFGTAVVFDDINGDGLDDLLVGSPLQFEKNIDEGAVFIFYGSKNEAILLTRSNQVLTGSSKEQSRFGTALECVGDLNKDGYKDVIVGAPYEDNMRGAVYLYHGGKLSLQLSQKIQSRDFGSDLKSFGWYISASYDIDSNNYPDVLIGSYLSNAVSVLRTRPIIKLYSTIEIEPKLIPLNSSGLQCQQKDLKPCVTVNLCFNYTGDNVPASIVISYNVTTDLLRMKAKNPSRVHLVFDGKDHEKSLIQEETLQINNGTGKCVVIYAVVQNVNRQFYDSLKEGLVIEVSYGLSSEPVPGEVQPILHNVTRIKQASANFSTGCAGTCHPELLLDMSLRPNEIILGVTTDIVLEIKVLNIGDTSYGTQIIIDTSENTKYIGYYQPDNEITERVVCSQVIINSSIVCTLPDILFQQQKAVIFVRFVLNMDILLSTEETLGNFKHRIVFKARAKTSSSSLNNNLSEKSRTLVATVKQDSHIELTGRAIPEQLTVSEEAESVLRFIHRYDVIKRGPSPLYHGYIRICLPVKTQTGKTMMTRNQIRVDVGPLLTWKIIRYSDEVFYNPAQSNLSEPSSETSEPQTATGVSTYRFPENESEGLLRKQQEKLVHDSTKNQRTFLEISCNTTDQSRHAVIEIQICLMEKDDIVSFDVPIIIPEGSFTFTGVSGIYFKSKGEVMTGNDDIFISRTGTTTHFVSSEIFPHMVTKRKISTTDISIWIITGGSFGGLVLLIVLGVILRKCGFFQRKKMDDVRKWKQQIGYYTKRQSGYYAERESSDNESF